MTKKMIDDMISELFDLFEFKMSNKAKINKKNGGFTNVWVEKFDEKNFYFGFVLGTQNEKEYSFQEKKYWISIKNLLKNVSPEEKIKFIKEVK